MVIDNIIDFFQSKTFKPYFAVVGDDEYNSILVRLKQSDVDFIKLSNHCPDADKNPDLDSLKEHLLTADVDCKSNNVVVLGIGEWLTLIGEKKSYNLINELKDVKVGTAHVVFLLRYVMKSILDVSRNDLRFDNRRYCISENCDYSLNLVFAANKINISDINGIRGLLEKLEDGLSGELIINTSNSFPDSLVNIKIINNHYDAIAKNISGFNIKKSCGTDDDWKFLYNELLKNGSLEKTFSQYSLSFEEQNFYSRLYGNDCINWLYYIYLLTNIDLINNEYIVYCLNNTDDYQSFKKGVLNCIIDINHKESSYNNLYNARKRIIRFFPESEIVPFILENRKDMNETVYKLTDCHIIEKQEIISYISQHGFTDSVKDIYPDLYYYSKKYDFVSNRPSLYNGFLTEYFDEYKRCKLNNCISDTMIEMVQKEATERNFNRLETRDIIVNSYDKEDNLLCWIDALGVEYLSFIVEKARNYGLMININFGRSYLPTITSINKGFFTDWKHSKKKIEALDDIKHDEKGGFYYSESNKYPIHLASELEVIDNVLGDAMTSLSLGKCSNYIIASDHGASRLAVIYNKIEKYDTDTQGEHSGRCCKVFDNYELDYATVENNYIVLADYGRFKGSRAANVEVHGGATLEEVVVPVICLSLKDRTIKVEIVDNNVKVDYKTPATFIIFVNKELTSLSLRYNGKEYSSIKTDDMHYKFTIDDITKAGNYQLDVYNDGSLLSRVELKTKGKSASLNDDFDF